jgi:hypothetical protein
MRRLLVRAVVGLSAAAAALIGLAEPASADTLNVWFRGRIGSDASALTSGVIKVTLLKPNRDGSTTLIGVEAGSAATSDARKWSAVVVAG